VQAIALIAVGTSLPDLFASYHAASDKRFTTADAAIANIFAANAANIFIGLGLPWTIATVYLY
jgi:solute carrier family 8 (sodium/calcium exchanger)